MEPRSCCCLDEHDGGTTGAVALPSGPGGGWLTLGSRASVAPLPMPEAGLLLRVSETVDASAPGDVASVQRWDSQHTSTMAPRGVPVHHRARLHPGRA
jgi:hypothetical protein